MELDQGADFHYVWNFTTYLHKQTLDVSKKYQQIFILDAIFFEQWGPFKR